MAQIGAYNNALNVLYGNAAPKTPDVQNDLIGRFSTAFSALAESLDNQEKPEKLTIEPIVKGQSLPLAVSYVGQTAEGAQRQLAEYLQQVDELVAKELDGDLQDNIKLQTTTLEDSLKTQEVVAQEQKDLRIKQIKEALRYAIQANVTKPQIQQTQDVTQIQCSCLVAMPSMQWLNTKLPDLWYFLLNIIGRVKLCWILQI